MSLTNASPADAARAAKSASHVLATLSAEARNDALTAIHAGLTAARDEILAANARDLELARQAAADGKLSASLVSRLDLGKTGKWEDMLKGILDVRDLEDPVGRVTLRTKLDDGLEQWTRAKAAVGDAIIAHDASITHHHAVGRDHLPWFAQQIGPVGVEVLRAVKSRLDPAGVLNPGVMVP